MPKKIGPANQQIARLETILKTDLGIPAGEVVPAAGELLGMATSAYYQLRRDARPATMPARILLHVVLDMMPPAMLAELQRDIRAWKTVPVTGEVF